MSERVEALHLAGVRVRYPGRREPALDGVGITVAAGERVGVTGRTGAGKSTLALVAGGFVPRVVRATLDGSVTVTGVDATDLTPDALLGRVGIVFATPANQLSASKQTVREELAFGLENLGVPREEMDGRIDAVLDRLGIAHLAEREPFALSGGEQQRVAIASIVTMGTQVLVLDEPTAQLDPAGTADVASLLDELAAGGTAILCVEHDPTVLGHLDRVLLLEGGQVVADGVPGSALGSAARAPVGLPAPTLVLLAEAAGLDPAQAFDEPSIVSALRGLGGSLSAAGGVPRTNGAGVAPTAASTTPWAEVRHRTPATLTIEKLVHRYPNDVEAVRGVSLVFRPGEAVAILGQNGSGKTTLVKHANGLLRPAEGDVRIDGASIAGRRVDELAATVGFVFQSPDDQLFERSVEREVGFGPRNIGFDATITGRLVDVALGAVGLAGQRTTNPYDLDLSQRKLVALASVLATDPAIVVLDEPTAGQDPDGVARVGEVIRALRDAGRTVIAITHDMEFAATSFDRIVVMRRGEVVADGPPGAVLGGGNAELLASTGLTPPPAARIARALGLPDGVALDAPSLLAALRSRG